MYISVANAILRITSCLWQHQKVNVSLTNPACGNETTTIARACFEPDFTHKN